MTSLSTFLGYRLYANNITKSLQNDAAAPTNATATAYYQANIGKVKSADDFVDNFKLFNYATTAYGLSDMANSKAFMKKVLDSNLSDPNSFVNKLTDPRYLTFAKAFQFQSDGTLASSANPQTSAQKTDIEARFAALSTESSAQQKTDTAYYEAHIGSVTSVSQLDSDPTLYRYVLTAYGIDSNTAQTLVNRALESNLSDPKSFANIAPSTSATTSDPVATLKGLQTPSSLAATVQSYSTEIGFDTTAAATKTDTADQTAAKAATTYYETTLPKLKTLDEFLADPKLTSYAIKANGLSDTTTTDQLKAALTSDPAATPHLLQTPASLAATVKAYSAAAGFDTTAAAAKTDTKAQAAAKAATTYYQAMVPKLTTLDQFLSNSQLTSYAIKAYGLPASTTTDQLKAALTSDTASTSSAAFRMGAAFVTFANAFHADSGLKAMAENFNFAADGSVSSPRALQTNTALASTVQAYSSTVGTDTTAAIATSDTAAQKAAKAATSYYEATIPTITSLDQFLNDAKLTAYAIKAYGLPSTTTTGQLKAALTSDLTSVKSAAFQQGSAFVTFAGAFNVDTNGTIDHTPNVAAQSKGQLAATQSNYLWQTMETDAGTSRGTGVQLALYFKQIAPTLTSPYQILGDKSLITVVQTALGLSSASSKANIDTQAKYIASKINFADFKDPAKLDKFISRFSALYDVKNSTSTSPSVSVLT